MISLKSRLIKTTFGAIHKVRTLGRGEGDQAKSVQVRTRGGGGLMPKTYVRLKKKMRVYFERYCI